MKKLYSTIFLAIISVVAIAQQSDKLTGTVIGTEISVNYNTSQASTTVNTRECAFDGNLNTYFASYDRSFTWVGLDLGEAHVITKVGFAARVDNLGPGRMMLGVFQGANNADFSDALPIYLIPESAPYSAMTYAEVSCSRGFRYVRYVGPRDARCNVAEVEFYGYRSEGDDDRLYQVTNLPTVVVNTPGMEWFHENDKEYAMEGSNVMIIADGKIDVGATAQIRGRGNASWSFPKKPFRIKFDKKQSVLGSAAKAKKWTMINNYGDKTLMRNKLAFDISQRIGLEYTPVCHFVDLVFNGEYQGCYQLCDQIDVNKDRVNITEMEATDTEGEALTGGYLIEIDAYANIEAPDEWFQTTSGYRIPVTIKSPDPGVTQQYNYIKSKMNSLTYSVRSPNFSDPENGYRQYLDLESFLKHFVVGELSGNTDTYWSVYMTLERGEKQFRTGPVWDFDLAFENDQRTYPINSYTDYIYCKGSCAGDMASLVTRIVKVDTNAKEQLKYIWSYARELQGLDIDTFGALIDQYAEQLQASQQLNFKRWPIMTTKVHQNPKIWGSYEAEVNNVKNYLRNRFAKLDLLIGRCEINATVDIEDDECSPIEVYTLQGIKVADYAPGTTRYDGLKPGIYIVCKAKHSSKLFIF